MGERANKFDALHPPEEMIGDWSVFWSYVDKNGPTPIARPDLGPCWMWTRCTGSKGYGAYRRKAHVDRQQLSHRIAYRLIVGEIGRGLTLDHLCRNRPCCNPAHLEVVTRGENTMRGETITAANAAKTRCDRGHEFTPANTYMNSRDGKRRCRRCRQLEKLRFTAAERCRREALGTRPIRCAGWVLEDVQ